MKSKLIKITTAILLFGLVASPLSALANSEDVEDVTEEETDFMQFSGVVTDIDENMEDVTFTVEKEEDNIMLFPITDDVQLFNRDGEKIEVNDIEDGANLDVYYSKFKPMPLIYPATIVPDFVIAGEEDEGQVKVYKFNDDLVSLDNQLKLNIDKETILLNEQGESITEDDLKGKELIVFYTVSTKSIPAQTTPSKVIALDERGIEGSDENDKNNDGDIDEEVDENNTTQIIDEDHYMNNNIKMIPLRKVSEELGYTIEWNQKEQQVTLHKENSSLLISIGEKKYGYNKSIREFQVAPELKDSKTYVSEDLLDILSGHIILDTK